MSELIKYLFPEQEQVSKITDEIKETAIGIAKLWEIPEFKLVIDKINSMHDELEKDCSEYVDDLNNHQAISDTSARFTLMVLRAWLENQKEIVKRIADERSNKDAVT